MDVGSDRGTPGHVLVTGGASGIGAAVVQAVARTGGRISVLDRSDEADCPSWTGLPDGVRGRWLRVDALDLDALQAALAEVADEIDAVVPAAGVSLPGGFLDATPETWRTTLELNVIAAAMTCRTVAASLIRRGRAGAMVCISSTAAHGHVVGTGVHYHASKGAVEAMTRALAGELGLHGIRVNGVAPGVVRTPMTTGLLAVLGEEAMAGRTMIGRLATADDVAAVVLYLLSPAAAAVTGVVVPVDGGQLAVAGWRPTAGPRPATGAGSDPPGSDPA